MTPHPQLAGLTIALTVSVVLSLGCAPADPGRAVDRMTDPLSAATGEVRTASDTLATAAVRKSQAAAVAQRVADTEVVVTYSRPVARGREVFGALVRHGQIWNPGADQATAVRFSRPVTIEGTPIAAGAYSVWVIPSAASWTVILNSAADVYHTPYPGPATDVARLELPVATGPHAEALTFGFPIVEGKEATLRISWGTTQVDLRIHVP